MTPITEVNVTPNEARKALNYASTFGALPGVAAPDGPCIAGGVLRRVDSMALAQGLSAEDKYALMAYHLLHHAARMEKMALDAAALSESRVLIAKEPTS
jgi:hypothetical protein